MMPANQPQTPPPGWYVNTYGQQQWWDGHQWGQIAPQPYPVAVVAAKESGTAYLLAILLGGFAAHRFYLNSPGSAIVFIILWWGGWALSPLLIGIPMLVAAVIWWVIDLCRIPEMIRTANTTPRP